MNFELQLFGKTIRVVCSDEKLQATLNCYLGPCLRKVPVFAEAAFASFELASSGVRQLSGPAIDFAQAVEPFAQLELGLIRLIDRMELPGSLIHAGCVHLNGKLIVVIAHSGGGKTTFTRELLRNGATYVTDDLLQVHDGVVRGLARALHFDPIDPSEPCPDYWLDTDRDSYALTLEGKRMVVPIWWENSPVALELPFEQGKVHVVHLARGDDGVVPLSTLQRAVILHEAAIVAHGEYDGGLGPGPTYQVTWSDPARAVELLLTEIASSSST